MVFDDQAVQDRFEKPLREFLIGVVGSGLISMCPCEIALNRAAIPIEHLLLRRSGFVGLVGVCTSPTTIVDRDREPLAESGPNLDSSRHHPAHSRYPDRFLPKR
jgi:hypothetical protein